MSKAKEHNTIPTLYHLTSSQSFPALLALEEAAEVRSDGLEYNIKIYPRKMGTAPKELKEHFPLGKSPIMVVASTDGNGEKETLSEARIIIEYISENYTDGEWIQSTKEDRKRDDFFREFMRSTQLKKTDFAVVYEAPTILLPFGLRHLVQLIISPIVNHFCNDLKDIHQYMEDNLSDEKPWLSGAKFGIADMCGEFGMSMAIQRNYGWDAAKYPKLAKWYEAMQSRPAYKRALEKGGPYDLVKWD